MPVWAVQGTGGQDEWVEAAILGTEGGALVALSLEGLIVQAWAPGQWLTVRHVEEVDAQLAGNPGEKPNVVIGLPRG